MKCSRTCLTDIRLALHQCLHIGECIAAHGRARSVSTCMCERTIGTIKPHITQFACMQANIESNLRKMEMSNLAELSQSGFSSLVAKKQNCWENRFEELGLPLDSCRRYGLVGAEYSWANCNIQVGNPQGPTLQNILDTRLAEWLRQFAPDHSINDTTCKFYQKLKWRPGMVLLGRYGPLRRDVRKRNVQFVQVCTLHLKHPLAMLRKSSAPHFL